MPGWELPLRLLLGFRAIVDDVHAGLAEQGHPDVRPMHGFVFQAIGPDGTTAAELGRALGVSKQAAGKTVDHLAALGYVERAADPSDARRKVVRLTDRGLDCLLRSARLFEEARERWAAALGAETLAEVEAALRRVTPPGASGLDFPRWFGGA